MASRGTFGHNGNRPPTLLDWAMRIHMATHNHAAAVFSRGDRVQAVALVGVLQRVRAGMLFPDGRGADIVITGVELGVHLERTGLGAGNLPQLGNSHRDLDFGEAVAERGIELQAYVAGSAAPWGVVLFELAPGAVLHIPAAHHPYRRLRVVTTRFRKSNRSFPGGSTKKPQVPASIGDELSEPQPATTSDTNTRAAKIDSAPR
ncbi:hypothetical protein [Nocardia sp. NPDC051463]|uniref:hypothetical protein n=1 Tax=Nocardia sp. NPDC051463 TaxID=3154845 RepID=UPI0034478174